MFIWEILVFDSLTFGSVRDLDRISIIGSVSEEVHLPVGDYTREILPAS
jgi:hypothetical protein